MIHIASLMVTSFLQSFAEFTELFSVHYCTGRQGFTSIFKLFPLLFLSSVIAGVRFPSWLLWFSLVLQTNNNNTRTSTQSISAIRFVQFQLPTPIIFIISSAISELAVETPIFAVISLSYPLTVEKTVEAFFLITHYNFFVFIET